MRRSFLKPFITGCNSLLGKQMRKKNVQWLHLTGAEPRRVTFVQSKREHLFSENGLLITQRVENDTTMCVVLFEHLCFVFI